MELIEVKKDRSKLAPKIFSGILWASVVLVVISLFFWLFSIAIVYINEWRHN